LENYVHGNLEDALLKLNSLKTKKKPKESEIFLKICFRKEEKVENKEKIEDSEED
jgi:hypothetical protein